MSALRQRGGQRSNEEGGHYGHQQPYGGDADPLRRSSSAGWEGAGRGPAQTPPPVKVKGHGPYGRSNSGSAFSAGYGGLPQQAPPSSAPRYGGGYGSGYSSSSSPSPSLARQQSAPAIHGGGYGQQHSFGSSSAGGQQSYGGIGSSPSSGGGGNPYQKKSSGGGGFKKCVLAVAVIVLLSLMGTTLHYRSVMAAKQAELLSARDALEQLNKRDGRTGGRFDMMVKKKQKAKAREARKKAREANKQLKSNDELTAEIRMLQSQEAEKRSAYDTMTKERAATQNELNALFERKQDLLKAKEHLEFELEDKREETAKYKAMIDGTAEMDKFMEKREGALWKRVEELEKRIGRSSWREAEEWFSAGPHKVELTLEYPQVPSPERGEPSSWPRVESAVVIDLAPLDLMPHAVNLFLQQVHHGLWEGCHLAKNSQHMLQFGPSYDDPGGHDGEDFEGKTHVSHFRDYQLEKLSYQEYSDKFPHVQFTVGFAGRPGGPDFYVNKLDNSMIHGPGGKADGEDYHNEADPCFGKVVDEASLTVLKELEAIPVNPERGFEVSLPVVVKKSRVLVPSDDPGKGWEGIEQEWREHYKEIEHGGMVDRNENVRPIRDFAQRSAQ